jgi:hypothetical protein
MQAHFVKENKESLGIFDNIFFKYFLFIDMESSKLNN